MCFLPSEIQVVKYKNLGFKCRFERPEYWCQWANSTGWIVLGLPTTLASFYKTVPTLITREAALLSPITVHCLTTWPSPPAAGNNWKVGNIS